MNVGVLAVAGPGRSADTARRLEALGLHTVLFPDSQNLAPEVWGQLMLAARATERIRLGPGVTNSITRDPAVTASAALALQVESGGRAVLGIGRGDSSVQRSGKREDPVASFERYLTAVQAYLRGEAVDRDGFASRLEWLEHTDVPKVPVEVAATGRRVVEVSPSRADAAGLAVGADPQYVASVLERVRDAARAAGRTLRCGAFVNAVIHDDVPVARDAVRGSAASFARFSAFRGSDLTRLPAPLAEAARWLREHYDMRQHTRTGVPQTAGISDEFVEWFAIAGPVDVARERFRQLAALGLDFCSVVVSGREHDAFGTTQLTVRAFDRMSGQPRWRKWLGFSAEAVASVVRLGSTVAVGGTVDHAFAVVCLDAADGRELWRAGIRGGASGINVSNAARRLVAAGDGDVVAVGHLTDPRSDGLGSVQQVVVVRLAAMDGHELWRTGVGPHSPGE